MIHGVLADTDRRYWRRQVLNRKVRKARRARSMLRWSAVTLLNLMLLAVLAFSGNHALLRVTRSHEFSLRSIRVAGAVRCPPKNIRQRLADLAGRNLLKLDLNMIASRVREEPWVMDCSVKRILPHTLRIGITEREPCALALVNGSACVVDRTGFVLPAEQGLQEDLPIFIGLDRLQGPVRDAVLRRGVAALERLRRTVGAWAETISKIDLSRPDHIGVSTISPGPRILLDPEQVERNLSDYLALKDEIHARVGPTEYVDLRWRNRITVMPDAEL